MKTKNSKVFEQKGDLLSFKVNVDSKLGLMLSHAEPSWAKLSQAEPRCDEFGQFFKHLLFNKLLFNKLLHTYF